MDRETLSFIDLASQRARLNGAIEEAIARVIAHGAFIMGPEVTDLESALSDFARARNSVSCSSGTDALILALLARDVQPGDVVLLPSFTFAATAEAVALLGAVPWFVDVRADTFTIDTDSLAMAIEAARADGHGPVGVIPVDLYGLPADYNVIAALAGEADLWVIADGAQSFGADLDGTRVGSLAPLTALSFFPSKPLGCYGDGGAVLDRDGSLATVLRSLRVHGQGTHKYDNVRIGLNARLDTIQAAILLEKLTIFEEELVARQHVAQRYTSALSGLVTTPHVPEGARSAWAQYTVRIQSRNRDEVAVRLSERGVPTAVYYPKPLHLQPAYRDCPQSPSGLAVSEQLSGEVLSLPMHPYLGESGQNRVVEALQETLQ